MFNIYSASRIVIPYKMFKFSGGEVQVRIETPLPTSEVALTIEAHLTSSDSVMELFMVTDALRRFYGKKFHMRLVCPYLPYARQDRVMEDGEALGVAVMCGLINSLNFDSVEVWDVHSDVPLALLNNVKNYSPSSFLQRVPVPLRGETTVLVAPDAGALKKVGAVAKSIGVSMVRADKIRSTVDGSITGTTVYSEHIGDKNFLIVDDICDGGRTFTELAKELRPLTNGKVNLYVTHGIFSKGLDVFNGLIDHIYVANPFPGVDLSNPILSALNLR